MCSKPPSKYSLIWHAAGKHGFLWQLKDSGFCWHPFWVVTVTCYDSRRCCCPNKSTPNHPGATEEQSTCSEHVYHTPDCTSVLYNPLKENDQRQPAAKRSIIICLTLSLHILLEISASWEMWKICSATIIFSCENAFQPVSKPSVAPCCLLLFNSIHTGLRFLKWLMKIFCPPSTPILGTSFFHFPGSFLIASSDAEGAVKPMSRQSCEPRQKGRFKVNWVTKAPAEKETYVS